MTVHMIRVVTSIEGDYTLEQVNAAMDDWVSQQSEWTDDSESHSIVEHTAENGETEYRIGQYRFLLTDAKDNLLQKCEDKLVNKVAFYRIGHHQCDHDMEGRDGCSWEEQREWTAKDATIPNDVPSFQPPEP